jgi:hypothetical protein
MLGAQQYLLHYKFEVVSEKLKVAYITRKSFEKFLDDLNYNETMQLTTEIQQVPYFRFAEISKNALKKIVGASRLVRIPKGWKYHSSAESNQFFLITKGTLQYECDGGEPSEKRGESSGKDVDLKKVLGYGNSQTISKQERNLIQQKDQVEFEELKKKQ